MCPEKDLTHGPGPLRTSHSLTRPSGAHDANSSCTSLGWLTKGEPGGCASRCTGLACASGMLQAT